LKYTPDTFVNAAGKGENSCCAPADAEGEEQEEGGSVHFFHWVRKKINPFFINSALGLQ